MRAAAPDGPEGSGAAAFPWDEAQRAALRLGISPADFWCLAPLELAALFNAHGAPAAAAPSRAAMLDLMRRFPDGGQDHGG